MIKKVEVAYRVLFYSGWDAWQWALQGICVAGWLRITQETDVVISPISYVVSYAVQNDIYFLNLEDLNIKGLCLNRIKSNTLNRLQSLEIYHKFENVT